MAYYTVLIIISLLLFLLASKIHDSQMRDNIDKDIKVMVRKSNGDCEIIDYDTFLKFKQEFDKLL